MISKTLALLFAGVLSAGVVSADVPESSVPVTVRDALKAAYAGVSHVEWDYKQAINVYEADFDVNGRDVEVKLSPAGQIIQVKEDITIASLPEVVAAAALKQLPQGRITDAEKRTVGNVVTYKVEVEQGEKDVDVVLSADGKVLKVK